MGKNNFYQKILAILIIGLILGATVPSGVVAHKSGTIQNRERVIGGYSISELEEELGTEEYGHDCYENDDYILLIFRVEKPKAYPEVAKVKLVLYDKNSECFSGDHEKAFELYRDRYLKEHKEEINEQMGTAIEAEGFMEAIISLDDWTSENGKIPSFIDEALKAALFELISYIIEAPIATVITLINIGLIHHTADHAISDFESAQETENNRVNKLSIELKEYDESPSQDVKNEILNIENWKIGVYKNTYIDWSVIPPEIKKGYEVTEGLTWNQVFTYYKDDKYNRAEGWFADGTAINICYANVTGELWVKDADEAKNNAVEKMREFVNSPTQENYRDAWIMLVESADLIRISYIFESMIHTQNADGAYNCHAPLFKERTRPSRMILPYPYSDSLYNLKGWYHPKEGFVEYSSWDASEVSKCYQMKNAIDASKKASYWKETSYGIITNYLLLSGKLADNTELFVPGEENKADLTITSLSWSPEEPEEGDVVTFSYTIKNQGTGKAGASKTVLFIDGKKICEDDVNSLDSGAYSKETFRYGWKATVEVQEIRVVADYYGNVKESEEGNNRMAKILLAGEGDITKIIDEFISWWNENKDELIESAHELIEAFFDFVDELISEYEKEK